MTCVIGNVLVDICCGHGGVASRDEILHVGIFPMGAYMCLGDFFKWAVHGIVRGFCVRRLFVLCQFCWHSFTICMFYVGSIHMYAVAAS